MQRWGLKEEPFKDNLDERFYFSTKQHERAYASMVYCITNHEPGGLIIGQSGIGKSLISQRIISKISDYDDYIPALILIYPQMPKTSLLYEALSQLGITEIKRNLTTKALLDPLHEFIIDKYREGKRVVLILDESHFLSSQSLHLLRTLTNLETPTEKLITAIFIAEDRFVRRLRYTTYESLRGRIKITSRIKPLDEGETKKYILHRLTVAGAEEPVFTEETYPLIYDKSEGIPRNINKICGQALFNTLFEEKNIIDLEILKSSLEDLRGIL